MSESIYYSGILVAASLMLNPNLSTSFEGGGALPEDTSCEGCGVGTQEKCPAGRRYLGRLGGGQENHVFYRLSGLPATPKNPKKISQYAS